MPPTAGRTHPVDLWLRLAALLAAGASVEDLAYLENFPGHPDAATLRQLAAALRTTSAALPGAGQEASPGRDPKGACWGSAGLVEHLVPAEYRLLGPRGVGRIAFETASGLAVLPMNYVAADGTIVIQTGSGSMIGARGDGPVSFEADHFDLELGQGWSMLVRGDAHRVLQPAELQHLREGCDLRPWPTVSPPLCGARLSGERTASSGACA
jgi:hypothetical protein